MRRPYLTLLLCALAAACAEPRFDAPEPHGLEPASADVGTPVEVVIHGRSFLPRVEADYEDREHSHVDGTFSARLGDVVLQDVTFVSTTQLSGRVPAGLGLGWHSLVVVDPSGAEGRLDNAFEVVAPTLRLVVVTPPRTVAAGECSDAVELDVQDAQGRPGTLDAPLEVRLSVSPPGAVSLFADPGCSESVEAVSLEAAEPRRAVYFTGTTAPVTATLTGESRLGVVEQQAHVVPGKVAQLVWAAIPSPQRVGVPFDVSVEAFDAFGNRTDRNANARLSATPGAQVRCTSGCNPVWRVDFGQGLFRGTVAVDAPVQGLHFTLTLGNDLFSSNALDVRHPEAAALVFTTPEQTVASGACSAPVTLELRDAEDRAAFANERLALTLTQSPPGQLSLFTDATCTTPLESAALEPGDSRLTFHFSGALAGDVDLTASSGGLASAVQRHQVFVEDVATFAFDAITSPQRRGADIPVRVRALDGTGAVVTSFTGSAVLALSPSGVPLSCSSQCTSGTTTAAFVNGVWTGTVRVGGPPGGGRVLTAASGRVNGSSTAFSIVDSGGTPPRARLVRQPAAVRVGQPVTFDASGSVDLESPAGELQVSFDPEGRTGSPPPWSPWGPITTAFSHSFSAPGLYRSRIAVRDRVGNLGYATADVLVLDASTPLCVVSDPIATDRPSARCESPNLSLVEAVRIANTTPGRQVITFRPGLAVSFTQALTVSGNVDIIAPPGVTFTGPRWNIASGEVLLSSLTFLQSGGAGLPVAEVSGGNARLSDVTVRGSGALALEGGQATIEGSHFESCASACVTIDPGTGDVRVRGSAFQAPNQNGINIHDCQGRVREVVSSTFHTLNKGIDVKANCGSGPVTVVNNTFDQVQNAVSYDAGRGHEFVNNVISRAGSGPIRGCDEDFVRRSHNLLFSSGQDGCSETDPGVLQGDPMFIDGNAGDFRPGAASPARDSGLDTRLDVTPGAPGNFLGLAPDRGGRETW